MDFITTYLHLPITDPTWIFFLVLCIILFAPLILNKLHIPHLIGMILAGVLVGEYGLNLLTRDASFELFGKVGIYFIMFLAGLEMDMQNLNQNKVRGAIFGAITTLIPFAFGFIAGYYFLHYSIAASLLLACIFASHTLVSYTIVGRYGIAKDPSVTISVVATMVALLSALIFLAAIAGVIRGNSDFAFWGWFIVKFVLYLAFMFFVLPRVIRWFFRHYSEPILQFTFTLAIVFFSAAMAAEICGLEGIFGAFITGLILNRFIPSTSPLMNRLEFVGNALFVPYFLIGVGMLVNVKPLFNDWNAVEVVLIMVVAGTVSKAISAYVGQKAFGFTKAQGTVMFGLTEAHAAGALAMVLVGTKLELRPGIPLMDNAVLDGVVMTILISCVISSLATDHGARKLKNEMSNDKAKSRRDSTALDDEKMLIPVNEHATIHSLVRVATMMRNKQLNRGLICLNIINDSDLSASTREHSEECLRFATRVAAAADVPVQAQSRLAVNFVTATIHAMRENDASELIIGLHRKRSKNDSFFGRFAHGLIDGTTRQLSIIKINVAENTLRKIVVAVPASAEYEKGFYRWINRISRMAEDLGCRMEVRCNKATWKLIQPYMKERHGSVRLSFVEMSSWDEFPKLSQELTHDHLLVVITARHGAISHQKAFNHLERTLEQDFTDTNLLIVYPDQEYDYSQKHNQILWQPAGAERY